ncbi:MAG: ABC transporter permease [candidate division KSB1 bacterium]|nr:ABC transporter permease [candidate division KSB1 bacterium]MDZ7302335.1 ABC transporter permease [candidate division KSB1 bacterium]MDZ7311188.1 ABC transporter permease [candidate division KSB1 bacterium]
MSSRVIPIVRKEFIHIRRDFRTLMIIFVMPVIQLLMFGYAINMEIQHIELAVLDYSQTPASRDLVRAFEGSKYFTVRHSNAGVSEVENLFAKREAKAMLIIPHDFANMIARPVVVAVQVLIDASDSNTAQVIRNYITAVLQTYNANRDLRLPFEVQTNILYNPTLKSTYFFVPGLVVLILMMISALLTSIAIAREKETGTMEQILVSPVRPSEIVIGKVVPYIFLAFMDAIIVLLVAHFWFEVPITGSIALMLFAALLYVFVALSLGLLISTAAHTQQVAMMVALISTLLPTVMLSGFIFPIASMPKVLQLVTYLVPARYFLPIIRGVMLKGNTLAEIWTPLAVLAGLGFFLLMVSTRRFKMTIEA